MGGMLQEQRGLINSVMKKGIQHSTKTPIKMPTIRAAFFSFCSLHVSPSVWKAIAAWRAVNTICGSGEASFTSKQKQTWILTKTICLSEVLLLNDSTTSVHLLQKAPIPFLPCLKKENAPECQNYQTSHYVGKAAECDWQTKLNKE